ncbi:MAG: hypothetical protein ACLR2G_04800 [Phascolarctobacterium faecium]
MMVQQMSEMAVRMNIAASQMENIMVETNKGGAGQNMARIIENLANASGRIESHGIIGKGRNRSADRS